MVSRESRDLGNTVTKELIRALARQIEANEARLGRLKPAHPAYKPLESTLNRQKQRLEVLQKLGKTETVSES